MIMGKIPEIKYVPTTCPYCGVGCGLNLVVNDGKLVGVEPYKRSPINEGKLCPKGATCWEFVQSPDRLTTPLIKKGDKFVEASWDEALDLIASKFKETSDKFGPRSLGFQVSCRTPNEDCYIMQKWARVAFKTNNIDNCARICHGPVGSRAIALLWFRSGHEPVRGRPELRPDRHVGIERRRSAPAGGTACGTGKEEGNTGHGGRPPVILLPQGWPMTG